MLSCPHTDTMPQPPQTPTPMPTSSKLLYVLLLAAGGITTFGIASAALFSHPNQPQAQNGLPIVQTADRTKLDVQAMTPTTTDAIAQPTEAQQDQETAVEPTPVVTQKVAPTPVAQPAKIPAAPNETYTNVYGNEVPNPYAADTKPPGATARCRNGEYSFSQNRRGTCSGNGGVEEWY